MSGFQTTLALGGARSGKSRFAETLARGSGLGLVYIATAQALDEEMAARIRKHRADRGVSWRTIEAPLDLAGALTTHATADSIVLVDCLTLWLSNIMLAERDVPAEISALLAAIAAIPSPMIFVSNEVGLGIVPDNALARRFRDAQGRLNQEIAAIAPRVVFLAAGLPIALKGALPEPG